MAFCSTSKGMHKYFHFCPDTSPCFAVTCNIVECVSRAAVSGGGIVSGEPLLIEDTLISP